MDIFVYNFSNALGWSILHSLWQGAALYLILFGLYLLFPQAKPRLRHNLAFAFQVICLFLFFFTFASVFNSSAVQAKSLLAAQAIDLKLYADHITQSGFHIGQIFPYLMVIYSLGLMLQLCLFGKNYYSLIELKRNSGATLPLNMATCAQNCLKKLGIQRNVHFLVSEHISVPMTIGFLKPIVLLPFAYANNMDVRHVELLILHELSHIKRNDYLLNLFKVFVETVLFFNPFIWLISRHIEIEREQACDDMVVGADMGSIAYAQALLAAEVLRNTSPSTLAMTAVDTKHKLLYRIKRITQTKMKTMYTTAKQQLIVAVLGSIAFASVAWINAKPAASGLDKEKEVPSVTTDKSHYVENNSVEPYQAAVLPVVDSEYVDFDTTIHVLKRAEIASPPQPKVCELNEKMVKDLQSETQKIQVYFESPEWKEKIVNVENQARKVEVYFKSAEWKRKMEDVEKNSKQIEQYFESKEWKDQIANVEEISKKVEDYCNSPELTIKIAKIEENAKKIEAYYNSPEWAAKIAKIEEKAKKVEAYYNSPEWKEKMEKLSKKVVNDPKQ